jgi:uncharacterized protein (DUF1501 family)
VMIELAGGNDGLSTVVPYGDNNYYGLRGGLAIPAASASALPIGQGLGFHPALAYINSRFQGGDVAVLRGIGHPDLDHSHFSGIAKIAAGVSGQALPTTGWLGRYLDTLNGGSYAGISVGDSGIPLVLRSLSSEVIGIPSNTSGLFGADSSTNRGDRLVYESLSALGALDTGKGVWANKAAKMVQSSMGTAKVIDPIFTPVADKLHPLARDLSFAARILNLNLGARVISVRIGGFDTHAGQLNVHNKLMTELDLGIKTFFEQLNPAWHNSVVLATFSEFGRRAKANDSGGTDHGAASMAMVIGGRVRGGLYGTQPSLTALDSRGDLQFSMDIRSEFASLLSEWMKVDDQQILGGNFEKLGIIENGGACASAPLSGRPANTAYQSLAPTRILDTRTGVGARAGKVAPAGPIELVVTGVGGVPATGASAVVINVTAVDATATGYTTVWPKGNTQPNASNLNFTGGQTVPNLVIAKIGTDGKIVLANDGGAAHLLGDVMGWFPTTNPFVPLSPSRLLDTRNNVGVTTGKVGNDATISLPIVGRGGVPATGADSVVLNVTVTDTEGDGYLSVFPAGGARPNASNLNFVRGRTVPNLVISKLGANGAVDLYNFGGKSHVIADVMGWFPAASGFNSLTPARILDTRNGVGSTGKIASNATLEVGGTCRGSIPSNATAIVMNVTVVDPDADGYLTVWPTGTPQPNASNINFVRGQTIPNLAICRVGTDGLYSVFTSGAATHVIVDVMGWFE